MFDALSIVGAPAFRELVDAGSVSLPRVAAVSGGLVIIVRAGVNDRVLGNTRGEVRYFQTLDGAASVLHDYRIFKFETDLTHWVPKTKAGKKNQGDKAETKQEKIN